MQYPAWAELPPIVLLMALAVLFAQQLAYGLSPMVTAASTLLPLAFVTLPLSTLIPIVYCCGDGRWWLLYLLIVVKGNDIFAYFVGKGLGRTPFAPAVSPKKTWEGTVAGIVGAALLSLLFLRVTPLQLSFWAAIPLGVGLAIAAQFGDLAESLLKREAKTKHSSSLPGLGGCLDMIDALIFSAPLLYIFLKFYAVSPPL